MSEHVTHDGEKGRRDDFEMACKEQLLRTYQTQVNAWKWFYSNRLTSMQNVQYFSLYISASFDTNGQIIGIDDPIVEGIITH